MFRSPEIIPKESHTDNIRQPSKNITCSECQVVGATLANHLAPDGVELWGGFGKAEELGIKVSAFQWPTGGVLGNSNHMVTQFFGPKSNVDQTDIQRLAWNQFQSQVALDFKFLFRYMRCKEIIEKFMEALPKIICWSKGYSKVSMKPVSIQAALDFKFLNDRYMRGKENVEKFMDARHKLQFNETLILGHSTIVDMQAAMGSQGFLCQKFKKVIFLLHKFSLFLGGAGKHQLPHFSISKAVVRLTILVVDVTLWPQRAFIWIEILFSKLLSQSTPQYRKTFEVHWQSMKRSNCVQVWALATTGPSAGSNFHNGTHRHRRRP